MFPSPCGDYGSYHDEYMDATKTNGFCFRPLAGIMVLIDNSASDIEDAKKLFPSPCGDYGSYLNIESRQLLPLLKFPSPCGDYGSYLLEDDDLPSQLKDPVSVPLRGLWFLSLWNQKF